MERPDVLVVGGGSAGLSVSHELGSRGVEHLVLERGRIGQAWRDRWDSFCLVTPNWSVRLPGGEYAGPDPDGYMPRDTIAQFLDDYAGAFGPPIREGVEVETIVRDVDGFTARTSDGDVHAREVVLATGAFQRPHRPAAAASLPADASASAPLCERPGRGTSFDDRPSCNIVFRRCDRLCVLGIRLAS